MSTFLLDDICAVYLPTAGLSLTFGTNLFAGLLPDQPDNAVSVFEYPGEMPEYTMGPNTLPVWSMPRAQVVVRNLSYPAGRSIIEDIARALEAMTNQTINSASYLRVERLQDPFLMHRDNSRRVFFAVNFRIHRVPN